MSTSAWTAVAPPVLRRPPSSAPSGVEHHVAAPDAPAWHRFRSRVGHHVLVLEGSQVLDIAPGAGSGDGSSNDAAALAPSLIPYLAHGATLDLGAVPAVAPQSISLNLTSACNLACSYCYADRGSFGGAQSGGMTAAVAEAAVDRLLARAERRATATIGFLGGEPFLRSALLAHVVRYASRRAAEVGQPVGFSVTTNGTLLGPADIDLLRTHPFAVTVSIDGDPATHDRHRRTAAGGEGGWAMTVAGVRPLLADPGRAAVSARATVTAEDVDLARRLDALVAEGFTTVGFSPVRTGLGAFTDATWPRWLAASVELGERCLAEILAGGACPFDNLAVALHQIDAGASSPYPCGAGGGYFSVATDGEWFACHRAIGDPRFAMDDGRGGVDVARQRRFLVDHHVQRSEPCRSCWARYLCSGGCHHEADTRTDAACDAIRAWLEFCLDAYCTVSARRPEWFAPPTPEEGR